MSWEHFSDNELKCKHCGVLFMDEAFMNKLELLRTAYDRPMIITSGYRCPSYNDQIASTGREGPHTTGRAVDIRVSGADALKVVDWALRLGFTGVGLKQHGDHSGRYVHLDDLEGPSRPCIWTYP